MRALTLSIICLSAVLAGVFYNFADAERTRGVLWHVVQTCLLNHRLTGRSFPCLFLDVSHGPDVGYAVLRSPLDEVKIIVTPTARTVGIEAPRLRGDDAPNYFQDAWVSRHFATDSLVTRPPDDDLALAVNSRPGRSQDQLHIHVACIHPGVRQALDRNAASIQARPWARVKVLPRAPLYRARLVPGPDLSHVNVVDLVAEGLRDEPADMGDTTIVVVGTKAQGDSPAGFTILARRRIPHSRDEAHGEALLDQSCELVKRS